jgi:hypothetical protein
MPTIIDWKAIAAMNDVMAGNLLHQWAKKLEGLYRSGFIERGCLLHIMHFRALTSVKGINNKNGTCFGTFEEWLEEVWPYSLRDARASKSTYEKLKEFFPIEWMVGITRANLQTLNDLDEHYLKDPELKEPAETMKNEEFCEFINNKFHLLVEPKVPVTVKADKSAAKVMNNRIATVAEEEGISRGQALEAIIADQQQSQQTRQEQGPQVQSRLDEVHVIPDEYLKVIEVAENLHDPKEQVEKICSIFLDSFCLEGKYKEWTYREILQDICQRRSKEDAA